MEDFVACDVDRAGCFNQFPDRRPPNINSNLFRLVLRQNLRFMAHASAIEFVANALSYANPSLPAPWISRGFIIAMLRTSPSQRLPPRVLRMSGLAVEEIYVGWSR
jgi:hypothetical protein